MKLDESQTKKNLHNLLMGELQTHFKYTQMAQSASKAGQRAIAQIFTATAQNEMEHAIACFQFLDSADDISSNLRTAIQKEYDESTDIYPDAARIAEEEGFADIADFFHKIGKAEDSHKENFTRILETLEAGKEIEGRTVGYSETYMAQTMLPNQTNPAGKVHGGELMKLMDSAASVCAARHCSFPVVTAKVDDFRFILPVEVGDLVILHSRVVFTGNTSLTVRVDVEIEKILTGKRTHALTANFIMVTMDRDGSLRQVPPLIVSTEKEKALFEEARTEYEARKTKKAK